MRASFALFWFAIEYFATNGPRWLNLGAVKEEENDQETVQACSLSFALVDMVFSHCGVVVAVLVFDPCGAKAFAGGISVPAGGGAAREQFCDLDFGADWFNFSIP